MKSNSFLSKRTLYTFFSLVVILAGTLIAIRYAKGGFRIGDSGIRSESGLLAANSFPTGAQVYVNDKLVTATDDTLYMEPGQYAVTISKDGYTSWLKSVSLEKELVVQTNARLFPIAPSLTNLTFTGIENISPSPDGQKILYYTASNSAQRKNGLYILDLDDNPLPIQQGPRQIAEDSTQIDLTNAEFIWSPDSSQIMLLSPNRELLLETNNSNDLDTMSDITFQRRQILSEWEQEIYLREREFLSEFPVEIIQIATTSAKNLYISPDKKRMIYTAISEVAIPDTIVPPVPATSSQPEERALRVGGIYIYDREEDKNFRIATQVATDSATTTPGIQTGAEREKILLNYPDLEVNNSPIATASASLFRSLQATTSAQTAANFNTYYTSLFAPTLQWYPDSRHLIFIDENQVKVMEYDGTNQTSLYSGPFNQEFLYPWPDGSRVLILTSFNPGTPPNLYAIELE